MSKKREIMSKDQNVKLTYLVWNRKKNEKIKIVLFIWYTYELRFRFKQIKSKLKPKLKEKFNLTCCSTIFSLFSYIVYNSWRLASFIIQQPSNNVPWKKIREGGAFRLLSWGQIRKHACGSGGQLERGQGRPLNFPVMQSTKCQDTRKTSSKLYFQK